MIFLNTKVSQGCPAKRLGCDDQTITQSLPSLRWIFFENWSIFGNVMGKSRLSCFTTYGSTLKISSKSACALMNTSHITRRMKVWNNDFRNLCFLLVYSLYNFHKPAISLTLAFTREYVHCEANFHIRQLHPLRHAGVPKVYRIVKTR